jgi:hypothetical protein
MFPNVGRRCRKENINAETFNDCELSVTNGINRVQ